MLDLTPIPHCATRLTVWGWGIPIGAFLIEGLVNWLDRTKLEAWVEQCYFGEASEKKKWKAQPNGRTLETNAWEAALQEAHDQAMAQEKLA